VGGLCRDFERFDAVSESPLRPYGEVMLASLIVFRGRIDEPRLARRALRTHLSVRAALSSAQVSLQTVRILTA
jgi:hypothetical protein